MRLVVLLAALISLNAGAAELDLGVGRCTFRPLGDAIWWQSQFGLSGDMTPSCYSLGVRGKWWEFGYEDLGRFSNDNIVTALDNDRFDPAQLCNPVTQKNCLYRLQGSGGAQGLRFGVRAQKDVGIVKASLSGGLFVYRSWYSPVLTPINFPAGVGQTGTPAGMSGARGIHETPYVSAQVGIGSVFLRFTYYDDVKETGRYSSDDIGLTKGNVKQMTIGVSIPL